MLDSIRMIQTQRRQTNRNVLVWIKMICGDMSIFIWISLFTFYLNQSKTQRSIKKGFYLLDCLSSELWKGF